MRLTPADVHNVAFKKPSIGKRGYDEDEVDAFLDIVEAELTRLIEENNDLRQQLAAFESGQAPSGGVDYQQAPPPQPETGSDVQDYIDQAPAEAAPEHESPTEQLYTHDGGQPDGDAQQFAPVPEQPTPAVEQQIAAEPAPAPVVEAVPVTAGPITAPADHHMQAARLLGLAQETAERVTAEATAEAEQTRSNARAESEKMLSDARNESERMLTEAKNTSESMVSEATAKAESTVRDSQIKAEAMDREAQRKYSEVMNQLTAQRTSLERKIDGLRTYEREYRSRLKNWISDQLQQLDASEGDGSSGQPVGAGSVASPADYSADQNG